MAESGWFAARPSGTENIYKIYAESFRGADHLRRILEEAQTIVSDALAQVPEQSKGRASSDTHQRTVSEAKEEWRNEGTLTNAFEDSVRNKFGARTMSEETRVGHPIYGLLPTEVEGFDSLAELALDMRWSWNHATDGVWRAA